MPTKKLTGKKKVSSTYKTSLKDDLNYARGVSQDNPKWRRGGSSSPTVRSLRRDVATHKSYINELGRSGGSYAGMTASSIKTLKDAANSRGTGGSITRKRSKKK